MPSSKYINDAAAFHGCAVRHGSILRHRDRTSDNNDVLRCGVSGSLQHELRVYTGRTNAAAGGTLGGDMRGRFDKLGSWRNPVSVAIYGRSLRVPEALKPL